MLLVKSLFGHKSIDASTTASKLAEMSQTFRWGWDGGRETGIRTNSSFVCPFLVRCAVFALAQHCHTKRTTEMFMAPLSSMDDMMGGMSGRGRGRLHFTSFHSTKGWTTIFRRNPTVSPLKMAAAPPELKRGEKWTKRLAALPRHAPLLFSPVLSFFILLLRLHNHCHSFRPSISLFAHNTYYVVHTHLCEL